MPDVKYDEAGMVVFPEGSECEAEEGSPRSGSEICAQREQKAGRDEESTALSAQHCSWFVIENGKGCLY